MEDGKKSILKVLVGSRAHKLDTAESDSDYRGVFVVPTDTILSVNGKYDNTSWVEGKEDNTAHEVKDFLVQAIKSNPSALETLVSPVISADGWGYELRELFPDIWSSAGVYEHFSGYSASQRKKMLEHKDARPKKYAVAYIRVLLLGIEVLRYGTMTVDIKEQDKILTDLHCLTPTARSDAEYRDYETTNYGCLRLIKNTACFELGSITEGDIIDWANRLQNELKKAYDACLPHEPDMKKINDFLLRVRYGNR
jgi:predicted nucleotidyltransferase